MNAKERHLICQGQYIDAVRLYRQRTKCSIREAKIAADAVKTERDQVLKQNRHLNRWMNQFLSKK